MQFAASKVVKPAFESLTAEAGQKPRIAFLRIHQPFSDQRILACPGEERVVPRFVLVIVGRQVVSRELVKFSVVNEGKHLALRAGTSQFAKGVKDEKNSLPPAAVNFHKVWFSGCVPPAIASLMVAIIMPSLTHTCSKRVVDALCLFVFFNP